MKTSTVEKLVWAYVYAGIAVGAFGFAVQRSNDTVGWTLVAVGALSIVVGVVLIVVRSRMKP